MNIKKNQISILIFTLVVSLVGSLIYLKNLPEPGKEGLLFLTVGLNQEKLENENSSYEILRATEHFSDMLLGWTLDPSFNNELQSELGHEIEVSGQKQEKSNIIFHLSGKKEVFDGEDYKTLLKFLESKINEYNNSTKAAYLLAYSSYTEVDSQRNEIRIVLGIVLLTLLTVSVLLFFPGVIHNKD